MKATNSRNNKISILKKYRDPFIETILEYTYSPDITFGVSSDRLYYNTSDDYSPEGEITENDILQLLADLSDRKITGNNALEKCSRYGYHYRPLFDYILDRDLRIGIRYSSLVEAYGLSVKIKPCLAKSMEKTPDWSEGWFVSQKIDGVRCLCVIHNGDINFFSRTGKAFNTLDLVKDSISKLDVDDIVFDGEICLIEDGKETFQGIMKEISRKNHVVKNPCFKIFDCINREGFSAGKSSEIFSDRYSKLQNIIKPDNFIHVLEHEKIDDDTTFEKWKALMGENSWEGLMLRADKPYSGKRTKDLLKYKLFFDGEYVVEDIDVGPFGMIVDGKSVKERVVTAVTISHKGHKVKVGSGFSIEDRIRFYENPDEIIGKLIKVKYFEETKNQDGGISLRFPTVEYIYDGPNRTI